ncbi:MAG: hypothetical protein ACT4QG_01150 [Sporichthyaceae bacterium]
MSTLEIVVDLNVDFMTMFDGRRLLTRTVDARPGFRPQVGTYAIVSDDDAEPAVARILEIDDRGIIELEVLDGSVESNRHLLGST